MTTTKNQHYIPRFILKNWCDGHKKLINVYDKHTDKEWKTSVENIASEKYFYDHIVNENSISIETNLADLENMVASIFKKIIAKESLGNISLREKNLLSLYISVQYFRTPKLRSQIFDMNAKLKMKIEGLYPDRKELINSQFENIDSKLMSLQLIAESKTISQIIMSKDWLIMKDINKSFYIGDSPVVLHNDNDYGMYGNLGFAVKGIQIYIPVTPSLTMAFMCPSITENYKKNSTISYDEAERLLGKRGILGVRKAKEWTNSIQGKGVVLGSNENSVFLNYLQVRNSNRFVFGGLDKFSLAKKIISENPNFKLPSKVFLE